MDIRAKPTASGRRMGGDLRTSALFVFWLVSLSSLTAQLIITPSDGFIRGEALSILHKQLQPYLSRLKSSISFVTIGRR